MAITEVPASRISPVETPIIWTKSPFVKTDPEIVFDPEFLEAIAARPGIVPHGRSAMEAHGFIPREVMREVTTKLSTEPHQEVTRKVTESSFATWFLEKFNASHRAIDLMNLGEEKYASEVLGESSYRDLKIRRVARTRGIDRKTVTEEMIKEDTLAGIFWLGNTENIIAIRNRIRLVHTVLDIALKEQLDVMGINPSILEIASGSARPLLQKLAEYNKQEKYSGRLTAHLTDNSHSALEDSQKIAQDLGLGSIIETHKIDLREFKKYLRGFQYTMVGDIGYQDYSDEEQTVEMGTEVSEYLPEGGYYAVSNVTHDPNVDRHPESLFREKAVNWPYMYEHTMEVMRRIIKRSGFSERDSLFFTEPQGCHIVVLARK